MEKKENDLEERGKKDYQYIMITYISQMRRRRKRSRSRRRRRREGREGRSIGIGVHGEVRSIFAVTIIKTIIMNIYKFHNNK